MLFLPQLSLRISILLMLLLLLRPFGLQAQSLSQIKGKLQTAAEQPLPYANVVLYKGAALQGGVVSAAAGSFVLPVNETGNFSIRITAIG